MERGNTIRVAVGLAALLAGFAAGGCSEQTIESATTDAQRNVETVRREAKPALKKLDLGGRVTAAIRANKQLPGSIRVDADTDGVKLRGEVKTAAQKELAGTIARQTLGEGPKVQNDLKVTGE